jgi:hypothetical protein
VVRVGFILVYLGFGYGLASLYVAVRRIHVGRTEVRDVPTIVAASAAVASIVAFWLPAISGLERTLTSWSGLDPLSSGTAALLATAQVVYAALPASGDDLRGVLVASLAGTLALLVVGNTIIQTFTTRGTDAEWGLYVAAAASLTSAAAGLTGLRVRRRP